VSEVGDGGGAESGATGTGGVQEKSGRRFAWIFVADQQRFARDTRDREVLNCFHRSGIGDMRNSQRVRSLLLSASSRPITPSVRRQSPTSCRTLSQFSACDRNYGSLTRSIKHGKSKPSISGFASTNSGRRNFSLGSALQHGHLEKPKPGEE
jgi:hypothetical protein